MSLVPAGLYPADILRTLRKQPANHYGLTNAREHLQELGAPELQLPPFDELKFGPMPDVESNPTDEFWVDPATLDSP